MPLSLLIIEDNENDRLLLERAATDGRTDVKTFSVVNGVDAALYLKGEGRFANRSKFPLPDLILLDLMMPLFNGFEFLHWLRNESVAPIRRTPVVVISSATSPQEIQRSYELGANSYVIKRSDWPEYKEQIAAVVSYWLLYNQAPRVGK